MSDYQKHSPLKLPWKVVHKMVKKALMRYRLFSQCGRCVKRDVCKTYEDNIVQIIIDVEMKGKTDIETWRHCSFFLEGELPDRRLHVNRK